MKILHAALTVIALILLNQTLFAFDSPNYSTAQTFLSTAPDLNEYKNSELGQYLIELAVKLPSQRDQDKAKALALAWVVGTDADRELVIDADFYFSMEGFPDGHPLSSSSLSASTPDEIAAACDAILASASGEPSPRSVRLYVSDFLYGAGLSQGQGSGTAPSERFGGESIWMPLVDRQPGMSMRRPVPPMNGVGDQSGDTVSEGGETTNPGGNDGEMIAGEGKFAGNQSRVSGLLVMEIEGSEVAGGASKMVATVSGGGSSSPTTIRFNQQVGPMMSGALAEVERFLALQHGGIPRGYQVTIGFEERTSMKDGPSAAVACALLLDSVIQGEPLDENFAVTGDMNADGSVQPVGGIDGKLRGAIRERCSHVAFPRGNMKSVADILILEGPAELCKIQIFSIKDFEEAARLGKGTSHRDTDLSEAMKMFAEVAGVVGKPGGANMISNPHVVERLKKVIEFAPNHASAELLLRTAYGNAPKHLSLAGSFTALDRCLKPMNAVRESEDFENMIDPLKDSILNLRRMRTKLDPRTKPVSDGIEDVYEVLSDIEPGMQESSPRFRLIMQELNAASARLDAAYARLRADPEVQEELNM